MRFFSLALSLAGVLMGQQRLPIRAHPDIVPKEVLEDTDALRADPTHYHLEFANNVMRVLRLTLKGGESVPIHDAKDALVVCLKECHLHLTYPDKRIQDIHIEEGKTRWVYGNMRTETNLSLEPLEMLLIEQKVKVSSE